MTWTRFDGELAERPRLYRRRHGLAEGLGGAAVAGLLIFVSSFVRALRAETQERDWVAGQATILEARPWRIAPGNAPHDTYQVRAHVVATDGREADAWAEGTYVRAYSSVGSVRPAWHHPMQIERFRFIEPRGTFVGFLRLLPAILLLAVVMAVFVGVAVLATR